MKFKLKAGEYAFNHRKKAANQKYGVHRKLVQTWCRQESELSVISLSRKRLPGGGMNANFSKYSEIDEELYERLLQQRENGHRVS